MIAKKIGLLISASHDKTVRFFDLHDQREAARITEFAGNANALALTHDEQVLFTGADGGELFAWDISAIADGDEPKRIAALEGHTDDVFCLAISPNGKHLASAGADGRVLVWELPTMRQISILEGHSNWVRSLDFSPDGATLASISHDNYLILWNLKEATERQRIKIAEGRQLGLSVCFHPSGHFLAAGNSHGKVRMIRLRDYKTVSVFEGPISWFRSLDFSDDGELLAVAGSDPFIRLLRINSQMQMEPWRTLPSLQRNTWCVRFVDDKHTLLSSGTDGISTICNIGVSETATDETTSYLVDTRKLDEELIRSRLTTSRDRNKVFLAGKQSRRLFDADDLMVETDFMTLLKNGSSGGAISSNGQWVGSLQSRRIRFATTGQPRKAWLLDLDQDEKSFTTLAFHPLKEEMAVGTLAGQVLVVKVPSKEKLADFHPFGIVRVTDVMFTLDGRFVAASFCNLYSDEPASTVIWEATTYAEVARIEGTVRLLAVSPEGCRLALVNRDQSIQIWNVDTKSTDTTFLGHTAKVISGDFSPDGKYLLTTAKSGPIKLWSTDSGQLVLDIDHDLQLPQVVFGPEYSAYATDIKVISHEPKLDYRHRLVPLLEPHSQNDLQVESE